MLQLTRLSGPTFALNPDLIERAEATPDTVVTLVNGSKYVVRESLDELVELIQAYRADIILAAHNAGAAFGAGGMDTVAASRSGAVRRDTTGTVVALHPEDD